MRYYDPVAGQWLSDDPAWNSVDPNRRTFCGGDPINSFDPDGRWGKQQFGNYVAGKVGEAEGLANWASDVGAVAEMSNPLQLAKNLLSGSGPAPQSSAMRGFFDEQFGQIADTFNRGQANSYAQGFFVGNIAPNVIPIAGAEGAGAEAMSALVQKFPVLGTDVSAAIAQRLGIQASQTVPAVADVGVAVTEGESVFAYYMRQAQTLDVSTGPNQAVFYSGPGNRALAEQFAEQNGRLTLEKTPGGSWLDQQGLFNPGSPLTREQAGQVWSTISQRFAQGASGNAVGFVNGARAGGIFNTVEYPTLLSNPNIGNGITGGH
jgi:hypothetical protein